MSNQTKKEFLKEVGREVCWRNDSLYGLVAIARGDKVLRCDPKAFDLYISGFPRSGNHFYAAAIDLMTGGKVKTNPVNHYPPYVRKAAKIGKPSVLLIRNPVDACASWSTYKDVSVEHSLKFYIQFHRLIKSAQPNLQVAQFEDFIADPRSGLRQLAERYNLPVEVDLETEDVEEFKRAVTDLIPVWENKKQSPQPNEDRIRLNANNKATMLNGEFGKLFQEAQDVYQAYLPLKVGK